MVFRRKRTIRKKRTFRRKYRRMRVSRPLRSKNIYSFKQNAELANIFPSATSQSTYFSYIFRFSDLPTVSEFTGLFDQYRILGVKITFYPYAVNAFVISNTQQTLEIPQLYTVLDYDDATVPTTFTSLDEYKNCKIFQFRRPYSRYFSPKLLSQSLFTATSGTFGQLSVSPKNWVDMANTNVNYYGLKGALVLTNSSVLPNPNAVIRVTATYYFQTKYQR